MECPGCPIADLMNVDSLGIATKIQGSSTMQKTTTIVRLCTQRFFTGNAGSEFSFCWLMRIFSDRRFD